MKRYDVQAIEIKVTADQVFAFVAQPQNLPRWTNAFAEANEATALMVTPAGRVPVGLQTLANAQTRTVDWKMTFPDGAVGWAYSRVTPSGSSSVFSFVLMAPPVPLERLEGALAEQIKTLGHELARLKELLET